MTTPPHADESTATRQHRNVVCPGCSCLCDDITLSITGPEVSVEPHSCEQAKRWFEAPISAAAEAKAFIDGRGASSAEAVSHARELLGAAKRPLFWGLTWCSSETQSLAISLADRIGAVVAPPKRASSLEVLRQTGNVTATLGELRHRPDLILFWGGHPSQTHPRFVSRFLPPADAVRSPKAYCVAAHGVSVPQGVVSIPVEPSLQLPALAMLRAIFEGKPFDRQKGVALGLDLPALEQLASELHTASFVAVVHAEDLEPPHLRSLTELAFAVNRETSLVQIGLCPPGNGSGLANVLAWKTGFAAAVDFSAGFPRELTDFRGTQPELRELGIDLVVCLGESPDSLPSSDETRGEPSANIPLVYVGTEAGLVKDRAAVSIETARLGLHEEGTLFRSDEVPFPIHALMEPVVPTLRAVLADWENAWKGER